MKTGAINAGIAQAGRRLRGRESWMIPILMIVFALGGTTYGMAEETLAFYPLIIAVMIAAGYDASTGAAVSCSAAASACSARRSTRSPPASPPASPASRSARAIVLRLFILIVGLVIGIFFVMRYAERVEADPSKSLVYAKKEENEARFLAGQQASGARRS